MLTVVAIFTAALLAIVIILLILNYISINNQKTTTDSLQSAVATLGSLSNKSVPNFSDMQTALMGSFKIIRQPISFPGRKIVSRCASFASLKSGLSHGIASVVVDNDITNTDDAWTFRAADKCSTVNSGNAVNITQSDYGNGMLYLAYSGQEGDTSVLLTPGQNRNWKTCWIVEKDPSSPIYARFRAADKNGIAMYLRWDPFCDKAVSLAAASIGEASQLEWRLDPAI